MKKLVIMLTALFTMTVSANAMSYEQARQQALFLTDKMAYELDLTEEQYEAAYEINLDYLMSVNSYDDLYGSYWTHRNLDMSYVLYDWQYSAYCAASYFYRPLYWDGGYWHFGIYARYPHRSYLYFGRPTFWVSYRGGHSWHHNGGRSWYHGRTFGPRPNAPRDQHFGMRSTHKPGGPQHNAGSSRHNVGNSRPGSHSGTTNHSFGRNGNQSRNNDTYRSGSSRNNGGYRDGNNDTYRPGGNRNSGNTNRDNSNANRPSTQRESSTRTTVTAPNSSNRPSHGFGAGSRSNGSNASSAGSSTPSRSFRPSSSGSSSSFGSRSSSSSSSRPSFSGNRSSSSSSFGSSSRPSSSNRSFGSSSSGGSRSFGGGSRSGGSSGSHSSSGGGHFGGRR